MTEDRESDPHLRQLGEYIRLQRQLADLSLRRLAEMTQVSNAYLSQIERGLHQPSLRVLRAIADALDIPPDALLNEAGLREPTRPAAREPATGGTETEAAIRSDPDLGEEERETLLRVYRTLRRPRAAGGDGGAAGV